MTTRVTRLGSMQRLWRYYQAGIVNTLFGYGLYAAFVTVGLNMYVAQILGHLLGMAFNYYTYSRHAFGDSDVSRSRFVGAYAVNYLLGLGGLWLASRVVASPYVAGLLAILFVSIVNYLILRHWVFTPREEG